MSNYIDPSRIEEFKALQTEGKRLASNGDLIESLKKFELAKEICPTPKVLQRIEKIKDYLNSVSDKSGSASSTSSNSSTVANTDTSPSFNCTKNEDPKVLSDIKNIEGHQKSNAKSNEPSNLSPHSQLKFKKLKKEARELAYAGKYDDALITFKNALVICDCPRVKRYIKEIESVMPRYEEGQVFEEETSEKTFQHTSGFVQESLGTNTTTLSNNTKETKNTIDQYPVKKLSSNFVQESCQENSTVLSNNDKETKNISDHSTVKKLSSNFVQESCQEKSPTLINIGDKLDIEKKLAEVKIIYEEARELAADGQLKDALELLKKAQSIHATEKVQKRINKIEELLSVDVSDNEESKMIEIENGFSVFHEIYNKLYPYQRQGVAWLWKLHKMCKGGVLGDDMGLGKTFQIIAFISGMIDGDFAKHILIIMPVSLLKNWEKEFKKWCPGIAVYEFHSGSKKERERNLFRVQRRGHVLLTSYGMVVNNVNILTEMDDRKFIWDYVILDEGHKIKNPTKTTKAVYDIPARHRLVLTGTPIQNNLKELWSLYDFTHQGTLLGSLKTFKMQYETPITRSREKDATSGEKLLGSRMADSLKELIKPYFLRRTKEEVWGKNNNKDIDDLGEQMENLKISQLTTKKNDLILWTYMSEPQIAIYQDFLHSEAVKSILVSKRSPLVELTTLKKICDHPRLLSQRACSHLGLNGDGEIPLDSEDESTLASSIDNVTDECLLKESGKLKLVINLLENLKQTGHRTLVFSLSRKILDMLHRILVNRNWKIMRLDGTVTKTEERERRIQKFQTDNSYSVFLLTTQVGGVGLTLTAADRVIIYDPSWNPATDAQAVDRVYRIGQKKNVVVYRLITCGTVEEKIYRRQIFKDSITRQATGSTDPYRYFSKQELRELFTFENPRYSATQVQLHEMHSSQRHTYNELEQHMTFLRSLDIFGISDHDLMFTKEIKDHSEDNDAGAISDNFIKQKVAAAHELIKMEASVVAEGIRLAGAFNRPYQETIPLTKKGTKDTYKPPELPDVIDLTENAMDYQAFSSRMQKNLSLTPKNCDNIQTRTPTEKNEGKKVDYLPTPEKVDIKTDGHEQSIIVLSPKCINSPMKEISPHSIDVSNELRKSQMFERTVDTDASKIEKLRDSSFTEPSMQDELQNFNIDKDIDLSVAHNKDVSVHFDNEYKPKISTELNPLDVTVKLREQFKANLTHLMTEDIADLSFDNEVPVTTIKKGRKSCARVSMMYTAESDSSNSNSNASINLADESEEDVSAAEDSSNSASLPCIPNSVTSTPLTPKYRKLNESVHDVETSSRSPRFEPELLSGKNSPLLDTSIIRKVEGNVGRITPLKVDKSITQGNSPFSHAMAASPIISPPNKSEGIPVETTPSFATAQVLSDDDDSPLKVIKKKPRQFRSDSEESDENGDSECEEHLSDHSTTDCKANEKDSEHSNFLSDGDSSSGEESDVDDYASHTKDQKVQLNQPETKHSSEEIKDSEDNERSILEQSYTTCFTESNSEPDLFESSDENSSSDECESN